MLQLSISAGARDALRRAIGAREFVRPIVLFIDSAEISLPETDLKWLIQGGGDGKLSFSDAVVQRVVAKSAPGLALEVRVVEYDEVAPDEVVSIDGVEFALRPWIQARLGGFQLDIVDGRYVFRRDDAVVSTLAAALGLNNTLP